MISVAIIEDIKEIREALSECISSHPDFLSILSAESVEQFLDTLDPTMLPDILLLDIGLPGVSGITGMKMIKEKCPKTDIIMLTVYDDPNRIFQALCAGACGYLLKNTPFPKIMDAIREVYNGGSSMSPQIARKVIEHFSPVPQKVPDNDLTQKEKEIINCLVDGMSYKMIAANYQNSIDTVRYHIKNIYRKLHVNTKAEVITKSLRGEI